MLLFHAPDEFIGAKLSPEVVRIEEKGKNALNAIFFEHDDSRIVLLEQPENESFHGFWIIGDLFFVRPFKQVTSSKFDDSGKVAFFSKPDLPQKELSAARFQVFLATQT